MRILGEEDHRRNCQSNQNNYENNRNNNYNQNNSSNNYENNRNHNNYQNNRNHRWNNRPPNNSQSNNHLENQPVAINQQINQVTAEDNTEHAIHHINSMPANSHNASPYLQCEFEGEKVQLLIDTGATVSVLTKEIIDLIIKKNSRTPILPISGVKISNAVGKKICNITRQIYCECVIGTGKIFANFIQIENLNEKGIIGADILAQYNTKINFNNRTIQWNINDIEHITPFSSKALKTVPAEEQIRNIESLEGAEDMDSENVNEERKFSQLMKRYEHVFSSTPGRISNYTCQIKVSPENQYINDPILYQ